MIDFKELAKSMSIKGIVISLRYNEERIKALFEQTSWMPEESSKSERLYCILFDYKDIYCPICGKKKKFYKINKGYWKTCDDSNCVHEWKLIVQKNAAKKMDYKSIIEKLKNTCLERYGVEHNWSSSELRKKCYKTCKERYGVEHALQSDELKKKRHDTMIERHGSANVLNFESTKKTMIEKYGTSKAMHSSEIKNRLYETMINKYGVKFPYQNQEIFKKAQTSGERAHYYKDTDLIYRGSFELDFLEHYYDKIDIAKPMTFDYEHNGALHKYIPDFYIPSLDLVIEIKSSYYFKKYKEKCISKAAAVERAGHEFLFIFDKDYTVFEFILSQINNKNKS